MFLLEEIVSSLCLVGKKNWWQALIEYTYLFRYGPYVLLDELELMDLLVESLSGKYHTQGMVAYHADSYVLLAFSRGNFVKKKLENGKSTSIAN